MENYELLVFVFVTVGVGILASELVIPSAGLLTVMAVGSFAASAYCAWHAWYLTDQMLIWWSYVFGMIAVLPSGIAFAIYMLPHTSLGRHLFVQPMTSEELTPYQEEEQRLSRMINQDGTAATPFSPGGMVQLGREKLHAESDAGMIDAGTPVTIVGVRGNRLVVRPTSMMRRSTLSDPDSSTAVVPGEPQEQSCRDPAASAAHDAAKVTPASPVKVDRSADDSWSDNSQAADPPDKPSAPSNNTDQPIDFEIP